MAGDNEKRTPGLAREIAERLVKWQMETGKFLTARSGERAPVIPQSVLERELQDTLSTREQEVGELVRTLQAQPDDPRGCTCKNMTAYDCPFHLKLNALVRHAWRQP